MKIGIIGFGVRIRHMVEQVKRVYPDCRIAAITDLRVNEIKNELGDETSSAIHFYDTPEAMLNQEQLDGVMVGTRCSLHTEMAIKVMAAGLPLFLEKPVATNMRDLYRLKEAYERAQSEVVVSFPLRYSPLIQLAKEIIDSGKLGTVEHVQAYNNVPYGGVYYHNWYRDEKETGGLFLQKATHDFDYLNYLLGYQPVAVSAMKSKQVFKGNKPAGLKCADCSENQTCPDSTVRLGTDLSESVTGPYCCFAVDTGNEDSGSALIRYDTGMHAAYSQNFYARRGAGLRGARLLGYKGTLEFDWYTGSLKVHMHHTPRVETYEIKTEDDSHGGGDEVLARNFVDIVLGKAKSHSTLASGLLSALMCLKATESAETATFQEIAW
ncbi:Gfo/Idh/MocA family protein [Paenibacillus sp. GCM10027628]|uniref:Gfo/Idh/MocA family protein n=1 Tax=Paenibacillus sp. GCM10027628 TaxID=3273413 RepID=UPI00362C1F59